MSIRRSKASVAAIIATILVTVLLMGCFVAAKVDEATFNYVFYNDTSPSDHPNNNSGNVLDASLSTDILSAAPAEVRADPTKYKEWFKEDLFSRLYNSSENSGDPTLLAQLSLDAMLRAPDTVSEKLLPYTEQSTEMWTETVLRFIDNPSDHITTANQLMAVLNRAQSYEVREITGGYTSSGYMKRDGITLDSEHADELGRNAVPMPILENSQGTKGYEIVFYFANGDTLSYRINCGYQPDATSYPSGGKTPTYKPPTITVEIDDPDPTPPPGGGDPDPTPKPTPDPKNPDGGPQGQNPDNPDYGGGPNSDNNTDLTPEPSSPSTYQPPSTPTPGADDDRYDTPADNGNGMTDGNSGGNSTIDVDTDGDGKNDDSFTGEVDTGPPPKDSLDDVHENPPSVEPGLDDGQNGGAITAPNR
ncbi:MAG: hypothetical protein ACK5MU_00320 [Candidatus Saccharimonadales bacterium]